VHGRADASASRHDVVFTFYRETWFDARRREMYMPGDRLLDTLLVSPRVSRLVVADPYRSVPILWARRAAGVAAGPGDPPADVPGGTRTHTRPHGVRRGDPTSVRALERRYRAYDRALEQAAARLGATRPAVITTSPFVAGFAPLRWAGPVTFYAWDDWAAGVPVRRWWPAYEEAYRRVSRSGRRVVAVSDAILEHIGPRGPAAVVPNGLAPGEWRSPGNPPPWFDRLPRPRILYVGVLDDRLDAAAVRDVAAHVPGGTVVLLGPVGAQGAVDALTGLANVHVEGPVARAEVAAVVHAADACVMPHQRNSLTRAMSPLKLYEYLAGGRPVAATDLPPVAAVDPRIVRVGPDDRFAGGVARALARGPLTEDERLAFVDAHAWSRRHERILGVALGTGAGG
jgi:glycosyltransferase involved in cell wall biosynthesis